MFYAEDVGGPGQAPTTYCIVHSQPLPEVCIHIPVTLFNASAVTKVNKGLYYIYSSFDVKIYYEETWLMSSTF